MQRRAVSIFFLLFASTVACSGKSSDDTPPAIVLPDAAVDAVADTHLPPHDVAPRDTGPETDHGAPSDTYPAFPVDVPTLIDHGGYVMKAPRIVTVTWNGDPSQAKFEAFGDAIGASDYWKAVASEYGIGPATSGPDAHVRIADPYPTAGMSTDDAAAFVANALSDTTTSKWPAPTDDSIYVLYLPPGSTFTYNGAPACSQIGGYHTATSVGDQNVAYAVIPYCRGFTGTHVDSMTSAASHEIGEAATDPQPFAPGYVGYDANHAAWDAFQMHQVENGDSCELYQSSYIRSGETAFDYAVQRLWSNASAKAAHDPCVPIPTDGDPYFTVVPLGEESITVDMASLGGSLKTRTMGYHVNVGETRLVEVGFISDGPMTADWSIDAEEGTPIPGFLGGDVGHLSLAIVGPSTGSNGNKATISITVNSRGKLRGELMTIVSTDVTGNFIHYAPVLIATD